MKYIIVESNPLGTEAGIVFPAYVSHDSMAKRITTGITRWCVGNQKVVSAGECDIFTEKRSLDKNDEHYEETFIKVNCYGESYTMNIKSRPVIDSKLLMEMFRSEY